MLERHYSEKGGHLRRGIAASIQREQQRAFPGLDLPKPHAFEIERGVEHFIAKRSMMRSPRSGK